MEELLPIPDEASVHKFDRLHHVPDESKKTVLPILRQINRRPTPPLRLHRRLGPRNDNSQILQSVIVRMVV
jgi:hypothetical protein